MQQQQQQPKEEGDSGGSETEKGPYGHEERREGLLDLVIHGKQMRINLIEGPNFKDWGTIRIWNRSDFEIWYALEDFEADEVKCVVWKPSPPRNLMMGGLAYIDLKATREIWIPEDHGGQQSHPGWEPGPDGWDLEVSGKLKIYKFDAFECDTGCDTDFRLLRTYDLTFYVSMPREEDYEGEDFALGLYLKSTKKNMKCNKYHFDVPRKL
jgi:hypothetical protein